MFTPDDDQYAGIDLASLGTFTDGDGPQAEVAEAEPEAPASEEKPPAAEPEKKEPEKPAPAPETESPEGDEDEDFEDLSLEELDERIKANMKAAIAEARKAEDEPEADERTPAEKALAEENAKLKADNERMLKEAEEREHADVVAKLQHSIASTAGKFKMTAEEITTVTDYMVKNPDLVQGGMGFEEAAVRRFPSLSDRLKSAPAAPKATPAAEGADGLVAAPTANGSGAPKPFKHTANPGDYSDITAYLMKSGKAGSLGKYT